MSAHIQLGRSVVAQPGVPGSISATTLSQSPTLNLGPGEPRALPSPTSRSVEEQS